MTEPEEKEARQVVRDISREFAGLENRLANAGFYKTMDKLNDAANALGWELADKLKTKGAKSG